MSFMGVERTSQISSAVREEGEECNPGRKTAEPSISSSEATGSNKSIVMPDPESMRLSEMK
jgi:hypothetical protein